MSGPATRWLTTATLALWVVAVSLKASSQTQRVVLLYDERTDLPGLAVLDAGLVRTLTSGSGGPVEVYREAMDLSRFASVGYPAELQNHLRLKYAGKAIDVVVAIMGPALDFLLDRGETIFPGTPIVFCGIDQRELRGRTLPPHVTGVLTKRSFAPTLDLALRLHPGTRHVVFVAGTSEFDNRLTAQARGEFRDYESRVEIKYLTDLPLLDLLRKLARLPPRTVVLYSTIFQDGAGQPFVPHDVAERLTAAANAPVYAFSEEYLGRGIVGGHLNTSARRGENTARLALQILSGVAPSALPVVEVEGAVDEFDWRQLNRWGIDEAALPRGSVVLFRQQTVWTQHRGKVLGGAAVLLAQALLIAALLLERRNRITAQRRTREAEQRYRTIADFTYDWEYWKRPDESFAYVSPSCVVATGYEAEAFYRRPSLLSEIVLEEDREAWEAHRQAAPSGTGPLGLEFRIKDKSGRVHWIDHVCTNVTGERGDFLGVRGSNRDISKRKQSELELQSALAEIVRLQKRLETDNTYLREELGSEEGFEGIIGSSDPMRYVLSKARQVAPTSSTVLLLGETGVGKDLVARAIHGLSERRQRPLVKLNCAALPPSLVESELFGHEKGAFTGAVALRKGRFEVADGSSLFLDEVGELPLELQGKLLRAIQDGEFERVGGTATLKTNIRLIAATNRRLDEEVKAGRFRADLWYRLNVFPITVPPLRQRREDIPLLIRFFVEKHCRKTGKPRLEISHGAMQDLVAQEWPGNVRELESVIERAVISSPGPSLRLGPELTTETSASANAAAAPAMAEAGRTLSDLERDHIVSALEQSYWQLEGKGGAAERLGINPSTLRSRIRKHGIRRPGSRPADPGVKRPPPVDAGS